MKLYYPVSPFVSLTIDLHVYSVAPTGWISVDNRY